MAVRLSDLVREHMSPPAGMLFYNSLESVIDDINILGYWTVIERAWNEIKLDGVLCIDGRPVLYLKEHGRPFSLNERIRAFLISLFWQIPLRYTSIPVSEHHLGTNGILRQEEKGSLKNCPMSIMSIE